LKHKGINLLCIWIIYIGNIGISKILGGNVVAINENFILKDCSDRTINKEKVKEFRCLKF
jgi:hypothetical protein